MINLISQGCPKFYHFRRCNDLPVIDPCNTSKPLRALQKGFLSSVQNLSISMSVQINYEEAPLDKCIKHVI